ncbi:hypothetical protein TNIN_269431 [Trichonephila inaurata madagascariensis]|uniref:Uncharacterized protein n=1 Tax=Trichonephila inaurata madagascariensis TaxID=2747483 RepID=A0A8X6YZ24_9ARAC|nr:hypothetical protein TNIN_269431 [Trichonephila inaurata madagascariensis]
MEILRKCSSCMSKLSRFEKCVDVVVEFAEKHKLSMWLYGYPPRQCESTISIIDELRFFHWETLDHPPYRLEYAQGLPCFHSNEKCSGKTEIYA